MSTDEKPKPQDKRLRITACSSVFTGRQSGVEYTLYEIEAETESGKRIDVPLRSFEELPLEVIDVTVTKRTLAQGTSYTLARKNKHQATREAVRELKARVGALEQTVLDLTERLTEFLQ
jgi:hypothetical protein